MTLSVSFATYATLADVRAELMIDDPTVVNHDDKVIKALRDATARIDLELANKSFLPRVQTRYFDAHADVTGLDLRLSEELIELTSVTNGDGTVLSGSDYTLIPRSGAPYNRIRLEANGAAAWQAAADGDPVDAVAVAGIWVTGRPFGGMWYTLGEAITLASTTTGSFTPTDASGADQFRRTPRLSTGMLVKATSSGTTEYMEVLRDEDGTVYLNRGARGSTAVAHSAATLSVWQVEQNISRACVRLASYYYKRGGHFAESSFNANTGMGERLPKDLPADVASILDKFKGASSRTSRIFAV